jgi:hypothetical protein
MNKSATLAGFKKSAVLPPRPDAFTSKDKEFSKSVAHAFKIDKSALENYAD